MDGQVIITIESDKARALLAYLVLEKDRPHSREKLVGLFWPEKDELHARDSLSQALSHLRRLLGDRSLNDSSNVDEATQPSTPFLIVTTKDIQFNPHKDFHTDVYDFLSLVAACKTHEHHQNIVCDECLDRYMEAAHLYKGDFLEGFYLPKSLAFEEWATIQREKLHLSMIEVLESLMEAMERRNDLGKSLEYARRIVELDELSESGCLHVMRLLALSNKKKEALTHYVQFQQTLAMQLGAEPGVEAKSIYRLIKNEEKGLSVGNLPSSLTPFIGRRQELDTLWGMLRNPQIRLICILGMGGCGKTRLALEAAREQRYQFVDGVYFVPLSGASEGSSLDAAIAKGLGLIYGNIGEPKKQLLDCLRNKKILFILDSFEMVMQHVGLLTELLYTSPMVKVLVTSRVRLNTKGEYVFPLDGMRVPPVDTEEELIEYGSVKLFIEAGKLVKPGYMPDNMDSVGEICRLLGGIPLSILLASTWLDLLTSEEIAVEIRKNLDFLSSKWNDMPARQRSLRATFEYSWDLLNADEQLVLMKLAVFHNPFTVEAALKVAEASLQVLHELVGKSLLVSKPGGLYQMHDMIHQYSAQKLAKSIEGLEIAVRQKHCDYFVQRMAGWSKAFKGPQQSTLLAEADRIADGVLTAWEWAAKQANVEQLSRAAEGLLLYYFLRYRFYEGEHACSLALENLYMAPDNAESIGLVGWLLAWQACFQRLLGNINQARQLLEKSLDLLLQAEAAGQDTRLGQALAWREKIWLTEDLQEMQHYSNHCAELYQELGETWRNAEVVAFIAELYMRFGNRDLAAEALDKAVAISQASGEPHLIARCLTSLAYAHLIFGDWEKGLTTMEQAASYYRSAGNAGSISQAEGHSGAALVLAGRYEQAEETCKTAVQKLKQLGDRYYTVYAMMYLGISQEQNNDLTQARQTFQKALELAKQDSYQRAVLQALAHLGFLELLQGDRSQAFELLQQSVDGYRQMMNIRELGIALGGLVLAQYLMRKEKSAQATLAEALRLASTYRNRLSFWIMPAAPVMMLTDLGKWELLIEAYSALMTDPIVANSHCFAALVGNRIELAKQQLSEEIWRKAEQRGRDGDVFEVLGRLAKEIESGVEMTALCQEDIY